MRKSFGLWAGLSFVLTFSTLHAGFMPKRRKPHKPPQQGGAAQGVYQRGPQYSAPSAAPTNTQAVQDLIQASKPGLNDIAVQAAGLGGGGNCDGSALTRMNTLLAQAQEAVAKSASATHSAAGCGIDPACYSYWENLSLSYARQAFDLTAQIAALVPAAQAYQACMAQGSGANGAGLQANPPGLTYANLAKRLGAPLQGGGGVLSPARSPTLDLLEQSVQQGGIPDYDGAQKAQNKALASYRHSLLASAAMGRKVQAGRAFAGKPVQHFDDPDQAAQHEYLRINYEVLGPKYEALAQQRSDKADAYAQAVLNDPPELPLPSEQPAVIQMDPSQSVSIGGAGLSQDPHVQAMADTVKGDLSGTFEKLLGQMGVQKELISIMKIETAVGESRDLTGDLQAALAEMGSAGQGTQRIDDLQQKLGDYFEHVKQVTQDESKAYFGGGDAD